MPKLGRYSDILKSVFFLYASKADALAGKNIGGTGFFISVPSKKHGRDWLSIHGVTNWHVAVHGKPSCPVIRLNKVGGGVDVIELDPSEWIFKPSGADIAITPPLAINSNLHLTAHLDSDSFCMTEKNEVDHEVGAGEDAFMVGRFVDFDGEETNMPAVRFGHISIMSANIEQETGYKGRSVVVDMHSRTGFSGSPVFVYRTLGSHFLEIPQGKILTGAGHYLKLLGIHWGQFPEQWELKNEKKNAVTNASLITEGAYVKGLSGMTCVVPATKIMELFELPEMIAAREAQEKHPVAQHYIAQKQGEKARGESLAESASAAPTRTEAPTGKEGFNELLSAAARKQKTGD